LFDLENRHERVDGVDLRGKFDCSDEIIDDKKRKENF